MCMCVWDRDTVWWGKNWSHVLNDALPTFQVQKSKNTLLPWRWRQNNSPECQINVYFSIGRHVIGSSNIRHEEPRLALQEHIFHGLCWHACCPLDTVITTSCGRREWVMPGIRGIPWQPALNHVTCGTPGILSTLQATGVGNLTFAKPDRPHDTRPDYQLLWFTSMVAKLNLCSCL